MITYRKTPHLLFLVPQAEQEAQGKWHQPALGRGSCEHLVHKPKWLPTDLLGFIALTWQRRGQRHLKPLTSMVIGL